MNVAKGTRWVKKGIKRSLHRCQAGGWMGLIIIMGLILVVMPLLAFAQEGEEGSADESGKSLWDIIKAGGIIGFVIILLSIGVVALIIEHFVNVKRDKLCPPEIVAELETLVEEGQYEEAMSLCSATPTFFTNIIGASLAKVAEGHEEMVKIMEEVGEEEANKLNQKISYLSLIGQVAPMLGLFGTVVGMIGAFMIIEAMQSPSPAQLAGGVYKALVTTCMGLFAAIPALAFFFYFRNKVNGLIIEIGMICGEFIDKFKQVPTGTGTGT